ncbi:MAG: NAD(P)-dependent oxidoreductase [Sedimentisphaerales bacterium]|nr:NAD(P)-dependent oxidoreductase [Sedimentisphaerales bacterium]
MNIAYIGMGIMGQPMALNLIKAGHPLTVHNRTSAKCQPLAAQGAAVAKTPAAAAQAAEIVFINVTDTPDVEAVILGPQGIIESARPGLTVIDNSTISPDATRVFAQKLKDKQTDYLDAPVSGGDIGAQNGTLAIMVGGKKSVFKRCLPILEILGSKVVHVGPIGAGQTCKACNQLFCAIHALACAEGINLARQAGIDPATMVDVVASGAGGSWALANLGPKMLNNDMDPGFMIDLIVKDLKIANELAQNAKSPIPATALAQQLFVAAQAAGDGTSGTQALYNVIKKLTPNSTKK